MTDTYLLRTIEQLADAVRSGFAEISRAFREPAEPSPDDFVAAPDPAHELETAKQLMRIDVAKHIMAALAPGHDQAFPDSRLATRAFALADAFVAEALAPATPPGPE